MFRSDFTTGWSSLCFRGLGSGNIPLPPKNDLIVMQGSGTTAGLRPILCQPWCRVESVACILLHLNLSHWSYTRSWRSGDLGEGILALAKQTEVLLDDGVSARQLMPKIHGFKRTRPKQQGTSLPRRVSQPSWKLLQGWDSGNRRVRRFSRKFT